MIGMRSTIKRQRGALLIFCLVFLLVLTMMSAASMESSILEEKMTGNMLDYGMAFAAAEGALRAAELRVSGAVARPDASTDGSTGVWRRNAPDSDFQNSLPWWSESTRNNALWWNESALLFSGVSHLAAAPAGVIEEYATFPGVNEEASEMCVFYRITARGTGAQISTVVHLQSVFAINYDGGRDACTGRHSWRQLD
jgi:type IV pilus assembly protein PilX